jgi:hypothetical protein
MASTVGPSTIWVNSTGAIAAMANVKYHIYSISWDGVGADGDTFQIHDQDGNLIHECNSGKSAEPHHWPFPGGKPALGINIIAIDNGQLIVDYSPRPRR